MGSSLKIAPISWQNSLDSLKKAHKVRLAATGGFLVLAAMVDIAKNSDRRFCKGADKRSFFKRLFHRTVAICTPKQWFDLSKDAVGVVWVRKNEKKNLLVRAWSFGKNHTLVSLALTICVANAAHSAYQLATQPACPVKPLDEKPAEPVIIVISPTGDSVGSAGASGNPVKISGALKRKIQRNLVSFASQVSDLKRSAAEALAKQAPQTPVRAARAFEKVSSTPVRVEIFSPKTPQTIGMTPGILLRHGAAEICPGHFLIEVDALVGILEPEKRWRVAVQHLTVRGDVRGQPSHKGTVAGVALERDFVDQQFDSPGTRKLNAQKRGRRAEKARQRKELYRQGCHPVLVPAVPTKPVIELEENAAADTTRTAALKTVPTGITVVRSPGRVPFSERKTQPPVFPATPQKQPKQPIVF